MSYQKIFDENIKSDLLINTNLLTKVSISSFYCCEKESYPYEYMDYLGRIQ